MARGTSDPVRSNSRFASGSSKSSEAKVAPHLPQVERSPVGSMYTSPKSFSLPAGPIGRIADASAQGKPECPARPSAQPSPIRDIFRYGQFRKLDGKISEIAVRMERPIPLHIGEGYPDMAGIPRRVGDGMGKACPKFDPRNLGHARAIHYYHRIPLDCPQWSMDSSLDDSPIRLDERIDVNLIVASIAERNDDPASVDFHRRNSDRIDEAPRGRHPDGHGTPGGSEPGDCRSKCRHDEIRNESPCDGSFHGVTFR